MTTKYVIAFMVMIIVLYIYLIQYHCYSYDKIFLEDLVNNNLLKTGDLILFKAYDNYNAILIGSYYTHIGIVYVGKGNIPYIFEANGIDTQDSDGIFLTPLSDRIKTYKGKCYYKQLSNQLQAHAILELEWFMDYAMRNMYYNHSVLSSSIKKFSGVEKCNDGTNCGELVFLCLLKLGLLPLEYYYDNVFHYLSWMCSIKELSDGYEYEEPIEIVYKYFK